MVIFPYRNHGRLGVRKLRVFKTSDPLKLFCEVRTCIIYKTIILYASNREDSKFIIGKYHINTMKIIIYFE